MSQNLTNSFTATGQSAAFLPDGVDDRQDRVFNISLWGTFVATVQLERSLDGGQNWLPLTAMGSQIYLFTGPCSETVEECEATAQYRLNCTAYTSGTVNYRISE
jgi:hypothetical protein